MPVKHKRVLFVDLLLLGDVINAAHVASAFCGNRRDVSVDILTYERNRGIAEVCAPFFRIFTIDRSEVIAEIADKNKSILEKFSFVSSGLTSLFKEEYDLVVNLTHDRISAVVCSLVKAKEKVGTLLTSERRMVIHGRNNWIRYFNDFVTCDLFNSFQYVDVFRHVLGVSGRTGGREVIAKPPTGFPGAPHRGEYFIIKPTTSEKNKDWGEEHYGELARLLKGETGLKCLLVGVSEERELLDRMAGAIGADTRVGIFSFHELTGVLEGAAFIIGGDTGIVHLAAAMNRKTVTITIGPGTYFKSTPYGIGNIIFFPGSDCYPCPHQVPCGYRRKCRHDIRPEDVLSGLLSGVVESQSAGALMTFSDGQGFLDFQSINTRFHDKRMSTFQKTRPLIMDYLTKNTIAGEYSAEGLRSILADVCSEIFPEASFSTKVRGRHLKRKGRVNELP